MCPIYSLAHVSLIASHLNPSSHFLVHEPDPQILAIGTILGE